MVSCEITDELPGLADTGENVAVAPLGRPLADSATEPAKVPFCAAMVMLYCADPPGCTVCGEVLEPSVNVGTDAALTVKLTALDVPPPGAGVVTVTGRAPAVVIALAGIAAVSSVALT